MTDREKKIFAEVIDQEGVWYGLDCYTDFRTCDDTRIEDLEFHRLREVAVDAMNRLLEYAGYA